MREQARVARSLQDGGLLSLSQTGTEALSAIDDGEIPWETVHALFQAWQSRDDLRQLAPDGLFDREDRREYGRWYAERQFELFGAILLALGQIEDSGSTEFRNRHETRNRIKSRQDNELRISGSGVPANSGEGGTA
jgi:hypothetical protein